MYDLAIIGGGPAGSAAGVYAARKRLKTILITKEWGGQSIDSPEIQNWIGTVAISGNELAKNLKAHVGAYKSDVVEVKDGVCANTIERKGDIFVVKTDDGKDCEARAILICSGAHRRRLPVPGADEFEHKGLTYCASCDGPLFSGMDVAVIGGGNAGFETAAQLLAYAKSATLLHKNETYKADPVTVEKVLSHENMTGVTNVEVTGVVGEKFVTGLTYKDKTSGEETELKVAGIFVEIGLVPNTEFVKDILELDQVNRIVVNAKNQQTSVPGIWAAGDCTDELYHQNNIAAGDAVKALEDIYTHLKAR